MRMRYALSLLLILIFINFNCKNKESPLKVKPQKVALIPCSSDTSRIESGIDAVPEGDKIHVEWNSGYDETVQTYEVYRGTSAKGVYSKVATVNVPTQFYDDPVSVNTRYYYYVLSVSDEGVESESSDTLSYKLVFKPEILGPEGDAPDKPVFAWRDANRASDYVIRVQESGSDSFVWFSMFQAPQYGPEEQSIAFNADHSAAAVSLTTGKAYQWRIDVIGSEKASGSESRWVSITIH